MKNKHTTLSGSSANQIMPSTSNGLTHPFITFIQYALLTSVLLLTISLFFYIFRITYAWSLEIISIFVVLLITIGLLSNFIGDQSLNIFSFKRLYKKLAFSAIFAATLLISILILPNIAIKLNLIDVNKAPNWTPLLAQSIPFCQSPIDGVLWSTPLPGTDLTCNKNGLEMKQLTTRYYGEVDLKQINNTGYISSYRGFRANIQFSFKTSKDHNIYAGIIIHDTQITEADGYILLVNGFGEWQVRQVFSHQNKLLLSGTTNISTEPTLKVVLIGLDDELYALINNIKVGQTDYTNISSSPSVALGLLVAHSNNSHLSNSVIYSSFGLDGCRDKASCDL